MTEREIFIQALQQPDAAAQQAYLQEACGGDESLRRRVEVLLQCHEQAGSFLEKPAATGDVAPGQYLDPQALSLASVEGVGSRIGAYKLLQQIGEGGMGVVFMAEQQEPVKRMVALKVIKAGMDSAQVIARFEQERQALALMDHPHIAKVLDAGTTASGRPFFVMELVKGIPITKYCDEQRLTPKQRLELFAPVCQAIQHAHQKGIIHRDIKPSNVLIAAYDGKPVPKVIDFGVAKATGSKLTERTLFTGFGGIIGTLEYMSPEQAEFNALDIDTRSDVYALGVLLYELLTGSTPLTQQRLKAAALTEALRLIREEEPPKPSTRLSESKDSLASVSAHRHLEPAALVKAMRGEVDWIVMKALEKDRTRRYDTATGLARDIQRYLSEEPVEAGPPSARYRLRKLAWKHRRGLTTATLLLALALLGSVVSALLAIRAMRAESQARDAERQALQERDRAAAAEKDAKAQRDEAKAAHQAAAQQRDRALKAEREAKQAAEDTKAVLEFFQDKVLSAGRPKGQDGGLGPKVMLREAVDRAEKGIAQSFANRPLVEASIRHTLGLTYWYLGHYPQAIRQYERAVTLCEANLGTDSSYTLAGRNSLALAYKDAGRTAEAIPLFEQTLRQREAKLGPDHPDTLATRNNLAGAYWSVGRTKEAIGINEQILKRRETTLGGDHPDTLLSRNNLASSYWRVGRTADAIRLHERNIPLCETKLGADHPLTLKCRNNLAAAYVQAGRIAAAIGLLEPTLRQREAQLGADHPETLTSRSNLAGAYLAAGRIAEAIRLLEPTIKMSEAKLGIDHPDMLTLRDNLALAYFSTGRAADAIPLLERNVQQLEAKFGADHSRTLEARSHLVSAYDRAGQFAKSEPLYRAALELARRRFGADDARTAVLKVELGSNLLHQHKYADAEPLLLQGYQGMKKGDAKIPREVKGKRTEALRCLVQLYDAIDKKDEAAKWRKELSAANQK